MKAYRNFGALLGISTRAVSGFVSGMQIGEVLGMALRIAKEKNSNSTNLEGTSVPRRKDIAARDEESGFSIEELGYSKHTYIWSLGDGNDMINAHARSKYCKSWASTLKIGAGVKPEKTEIGRVNNDLILLIGETKEFLTVKNWHKGASYQLKKVVFDEGTTWTRAEINAMPTILHGTENIFEDSEADDILAHAFDACHGF